MIRTSQMLLAFVTAAIALFACQSHAPASLDALKHEQRKRIYKECVRSSAHQNAAIALYLDMAEVSRACKKVANDSLSPVSP